MRFDVHHHIELGPEVRRRFDDLSHKLDLINRRIDQMATKAQIDKFMADVVALIDAGVAEITAAVAAAQKESTDPAIDALDTKVTAATQALKDAAAALAPPPATPAA
jgi:hypothetical protein